MYIWYSHCDKLNAIPFAEWNNKKKENKKANKNGLKRLDSRESEH